MEVDHCLLTGRIAETLCGAAPAHAGNLAEGPDTALRELANDDIVQRQPKGAIPAPVEYSLTDYGRTLLPLVESIRSWGNSHIERMTAPADAL